MERRQKQRKYFYGRTQKEVLDKLNQAKIALAHGLELASERLTLETWLKQWLENQEPPASKPKAYAAYEYQIREHLIPELGRIVLTKLVPQDVRAFMKHKLATGLSPRTVRHLRATLRAALNMAVSDGILARNAASLTKPPRVPRRTPTVFDQAQALMFLEHAKGSRLEAAFTVAIAVAMREG